MRDVRRRIRQKGNQYGQQGISEDGLRPLSALCGSGRQAPRLHRQLLPPGDLFLPAQVHRGGDHETCKAIQAAGSFSVTLLGADAPGEIIDLFGYKSGRVTDKFAGRAAETDSNGNPYLKEHMVSRIACKVVDQMEIGSFLLFVGQATEAEVLGDGRVLTLQAYTDRGKATPPTATVYRTVEINGYRCTVCGYVYEGESLPPDFRCPLCHAPAEKFVKIEK